MLSNSIPRPNPIVVEMGLWLEDGVQKHSAIRDECHENAQHGAEDCGCDLAVLDVHPDEYEALNGEDGGGQDC